MTFAFSLFRLSLDVLECLRAQYFVDEIKDEETQKLISLIDFKDHTNLQYEI